MRRSADFKALIVSSLLTLGLSGNHAQAQSTEQAVRGQTEVYLVPFSHLDFFWGGTREECLARGNRIIAKAIKLANEHPEFRFLIEDEDFLANYVETHGGSAELNDLKRL